MKTYGNASMILVILPTSGNSRFITAGFTKSLNGVDRRLSAGLAGYFLPLA